MKNLYVFNPDSSSFVPAEWWLNQKDPFRAELVGIKTERGMLVLEKRDLGDYDFKKAQEVAKAFKVDGFDHEFRCPTRREVLDIQDAIEDELHELFRAIGGDTLIGYWCWTCERFSEMGWFARWLSRRNGVGSGWDFYGSYGALSNNNVSYANRVQAVTLLRLD